MIRDIEGYEGIYSITSSGAVISQNGRRKTEIAANGYERVSLWKKGKQKKYLIHRLVAAAFIPNPNGFKCVNHIDGNKLNNNADNLEWCNESHNMQHAYKNNLIHPATTKVIQYTKDFVMIREWDSIQEACDVLGLTHSNISTVCKNNTNRKYCGGYIWRYAKEN